MHRSRGGRSRGASVPFRRSEWFMEGDATTDGYSYFVCCLWDFCKRPALLVEGPARDPGDGALLALRCGRCLRAGAAGPRAGIRLGQLGCRGQRRRQAAPGRGGAGGEGGRGRGGGWSGVPGILWCGNRRVGLEGGVAEAARQISTENPENPFVMLVFTSAARAARRAVPRSHATYWHSVRVPMAVGFGPPGAPRYA